MRGGLITMAVVTALATAGTANAGCWATVGLSLPPDGLTPGKKWTARLTVLQHGMTVMPDARPKVVIENANTGAKRVFPARATDGRGSYTAGVVFPSKGSWRLAVFDGFAADGYPVRACQQTHTFGTVAIGGEPGRGAPGQTPRGGKGPSAAGITGSGGESPLWPVLAAGLGGLAVACTGLRLRRRSVKAPATR